MNPRVVLLPATALGLALGACVHTPPGTSVEIALARKAELIRLPTPPEPPRMMARTHVFVAPVEPELPVLTDRVEAVALAYTRGKFAMEDGKDTEAIGAFEETVKLDPSHVEAWQSLGALYEKRGDAKKAHTALRNVEKIAPH